jgi:hypothetical protein
MLFLIFFNRDGNRIYCKQQYFTIAIFKYTFTKNILSLKHQGNIPNVVTD